MMDVAYYIIGLPLVIIDVTCDMMCITCEVMDCDMIVVTCDMIDNTQTVSCSEASTVICFLGNVLA
jgi:hypothetical protein